MTITSFVGELGGFVKKLFSYLALSFLSFALISCATTGSTSNSNATAGSSSDPNDFTTEAYQSNIDGAFDILESFKDFDQDHVPAGKINAPEISQLLQADLYYNQGDYARAYPLYKNLAAKYNNPRLTYKAIASLSRVAVTPEQQKALNALIKQFIKSDPQSQIAKLFEIKTSLYNANYSLAESDLALLIKSHPDMGRGIFLFLSSLISSDLNLNISGISTNLAVSNSVNKFAGYVIDNYRNSYPEANLFAAISYSITNSQKPLAKTLLYITDQYPTWKIPAYWSLDILSLQKHNETIVYVLNKILAKQNPPDQILQNIYVATLINQNQTNVAKAYLLEELQKSNQPSSNLLINLGIIEIKEGNMQGAVNYFNQVNVVSNKATNNLVRLLSGLLYDYQNKYSEAISCYQKIQDIDNQLKPLVNVLVYRDYYKLGDTAQLESAINQAIREQGLTGAKAVIYRSGAYSGLGDYQKANQILEQNIKQYRKNKEFLYQAAATAVFAKKTLRSIELYTQYIKSYPKSAEGYNDLAFLYADQTSQYKLALKYAKQAYKMTPADPNVLDTLGWSYYKLKNYTLAYKYLNKSYTMAPSPEVAVHLKQTLQALHKTTEADAVVVVNHADMDTQLNNQVLAKVIVLLMYVQYGMGVK